MGEGRYSGITSKCGLIACYLATKKSEYRGATLLEKGAEKGPIEGVPRVRSSSRRAARSVAQIQNPMLIS